MEKIYKLSYLFFCTVSLRASTNIYHRDKVFLFRKLMDKIYNKPYLLTIILISTLIIVVIFTGKIYFGLYSFFCFPCLLTIIRCLNDYGCTNFIYDVYTCDYINNKWTSIRYS